MSIRVQVIVPAKSFENTLNRINQGLPWNASLNKGEYGPGQFVAISVSLSSYDIINIKHDDEGGVAGSPAEVLDCVVRPKELRPVSGDRKLEPEL